MPEPFTALTSRTVVLAQDNIDTDQIIPARFLTTTTREGLGRHAFHDWRHDEAGLPLTGSPVDLVDADHRILVAGRNFGCGSSREHAPWALLDLGVRAVISSEIADIFCGNALKNGLLPVVVDEAAHAELLTRSDHPVTIDLERQEVRFGNHVAAFAIEAFARRCLLDGVDSFGFLLARTNSIAAFEAAR